ncbi:MAG: hypothetical protein GC165_00805 [Armatimonadetes bacterium]|nr:hypothetical protein [Armatimonadota bacterium]
MAKLKLAVQGFNDKPESQRWMVLCVLICSLLAIVAWSLFLLSTLAIHQSPDTGKKYYLVSDRPSAKDNFFIDYTQEHENIRYMRASSDYATSLLKDVGGLSAVTKAKEGDRCVLFDAENIHHYFTSLGVIIQKMDRSAQDVTVRTQGKYLFGSAIGLAIGILFTHGLRKVLLPIMLGLSILSMLKYATPCLVCINTTLFGLDAALWGLIIYSTVFLLVYFDIGPGYFLMLTVPGLVAIWQVINMAFYSTSFCPICLMILSLNFAMCGASIQRPLKIRRFNQVRKHKIGFALAYLALAVTTTAKFSVVQRPYSSEDASVAQLRRKVQMEQKSNLAGKSLESLGLSIKVPKGGCIICVGSPSCRPCSLARLWLSRLSEVTLVSVQVVESKSEKPIWQNYITDGRKFPYSPTVMAVGSDGVVKSEIFGWSDDVPWQSTATRELISSLTSPPADSQKGK